MNQRERRLLRHYLAAIAYRTRKAVTSAPPGFGEFRAGHGVRAPVEILNHMRGRILFVRRRLTPGEEGDPPLATWADEVTAFSRALGDLDTDLAGGAQLSARTVERLLQGPLADVMTHVGQLAMLRRLAGSPLPAESFYDAELEPGQVDIEASPPGST